jgi:predicted MPP superfamily phosphohydrolase
LKCPGLKGNVTFAHLTDIHLGAVYGKEFIQKLVNLILKANVDFVCITGDMIDGNIKMTREMLEPFEKIKCPIYFVSGNHEDYTWKEEAYRIIDTTNMKRIGDSIINFNDKINIIGIDYIYNSEIIKKKLKSLLKNQSSSNLNPNILLYHVPIFTAKDLEGYNIFMFLCGHFHGGHFFPFTLIRLLRNKFVFEGLYNYKNKHYVYCNSGQGTSGPCVRSFSKSQIGIIKLEGEKLN